MCIYGGAKSVATGGGSARERGGEEGRGGKRQRQRRETLMWSGLATLAVVAAVVDADAVGRGWNRQW